MHPQLTLDEWKQRFIGALLALTDCSEEDAVEVANEFSADEVRDTCPVETARECVGDPDEEVAGDEREVA